MEKVSKRQDGISLVALIVTIIVMVILAGIIITAAVAEGGVIDRAKESLVQQERADVQDIIIGSYVFKTTASSETFKYLDLKKTGIAIYQNLDANDFTLEEYDEVDEDGKKVRSAPLLTDSEGNISGIEAIVTGKHGEYKANLDKEGLERDVGIEGNVEENDKEIEDDKEIENDDEKELSDLDKLKKYFVTAPILKYSIGNNGPVFDNSMLLNVVLDENFNPITIEFKNNNILTEDEAKSIVFDYTILMGELENGPLDLRIQYNGKNYIVKSNVEINETEMLIKISATDVALYEIPQGEIDELNKYFFEMPEEGSNVTPKGKTIYGTLWSGDVTFVDDPDTQINENEELKLGELNLSNADYFYFRYNAKVYKVKLNKNDFTAVWNSQTNTGVELDYQATGDSKLGKYVKYDDKLWIVLYDDKELESSQGAQLISADALEINNVTLGYNDSMVEWDNVNHDYIKDGTYLSSPNLSYELELEKAIYSYNNAIDSLNKKSASLVNDKSKIAIDKNGEYIIRSVGSDPIYRNKENLYGDENFFNKLNENEWYNENSLKELIKNNDNNCQQDISRMSMLKVTVTDNMANIGDIRSTKVSYWLASRSSTSTSTSIRLLIRRINYSLGAAYQDETHIGNISTTGFGKVNDYLTQGIRPVITLKPGAINNLTGSGTIKDPYVLK